MDLHVPNCELFAGRSCYKGSSLVSSSLHLDLFAKQEQHARRMNLPSTYPGRQGYLGYPSSESSISVRSNGMVMVSEPGESCTCVAFS